MRKGIRATCLLLVVSCAAAPVQAEEGDYSQFQTAINLLFPPRGDNPVRAAETTGAYGLKVNARDRAKPFNALYFLVDQLLGN